MKICVCETTEELGEKTSKAFYMNGPVICFAENYEHAVATRTKERSSGVYMIIFTVDPEAKKRLATRSRQVRICGFLLIISFIILSLIVYAR